MMPAARHQPHREATLLQYSNVCPTNTAELSCCSNRSPKHTAAAEVHAHRRLQQRTLWSFLRQNLPAQHRTA